MLIFINILKLWLHLESVAQLNKSSQSVSGWKQCLCSPPCNSAHFLLMPWIAPSSWAQSVTWSHPYFQLLGLLILNLLAIKSKALMYMDFALSAIACPLGRLSSTFQTNAQPFGASSSVQNSLHCPHLLNLVHPSSKFPKAQNASLPPPQHPCQNSTASFMHHVLNEFLMYLSSQLTCKWLRTQTTSHSALLTSAPRQDEGKRGIY